MLIDMHAHSSGISHCCRIAVPEVLRQAKAIGLDGIVLTNHYQKSYIGDSDIQDFVQRYVDEYRYAKECGQKTGCRVFFGVEVTAEFSPNIHLLIYGVDETFLKKHPLVFDYSLEELYAVVKAENATLIQAHPFRNGAHILDTDYLDGIEINCHPLYKRSYSDELIEAAEHTGIILTCGGDFHADTYRPHCGMYLPDGIQDSYDIGAYLRSTDRVELLIHEPDTPTAVDVEFFRQATDRV